MRITVENYKQGTVYPRVVQATHAILANKDELAPVDLFIQMGLVDRNDVLRWRRGGVPYLEKVVHCNLSKANRILRVLGMHAHDLNLGRKVVRYVVESGKRREIPLRFSKTGDSGIERVYTTHFYIIGAPEKFRARLLENK